MHKSDTQIVSKMYKELALINNKGQEKKKSKTFAETCQKKTYKWPTRAQKSGQHYLLFEKYK